MFIKLRGAGVKHDKEKIIGVIIFIDLVGSEKLLDANNLDVFKEYTISVLSSLRQTILKAKEQKLANVEKSDIFLELLGDGIFIVIPIEKIWGRTIEDKKANAFQIVESFYENVRKSFQSWEYRIVSGIAELIIYDYLGLGQYISPTEFWIKLSKKFEEGLIWIDKIVSFEDGISNNVSKYGKYLEIERQNSGKLITMMKNYVEEAKKYVEGAIKEEAEHIYKQAGYIYDPFKEEMDKETEKKVKIKNLSKFLELTLEKDIKQPTLVAEKMLGKNPLKAIEKYVEEDFDNILFWIKHRAQSYISEGLFEELEREYGKEAHKKLKEIIEEAIKILDNKKEVKNKLMEEINSLLKMETLVGLFTLEDFRRRETLAEMFLLDERKNKRGKKKMVR